MRRIKPIELELINKLTNGKFAIPNYVLELKDGKMGSISFDLQKKKTRHRQIVEAEYLDSDGILVSIELTEDSEGNLYELDLWKVDFNPLITYPTFDKVRIKTVE
jgi:hypothetical protein